MTDRPVRSAQHVSRMCVVCGVENPLSLGGHFYELDDGELLGVFSPRPEHQGYPGRMHGGIITALLDETIGRAINMGRTVDAAEAGNWGVTVEFTVKFRKPVPLEGELRVIGRITKDGSRLFEGTGELLLADGTVAAEGHGRYLRMPLEAISDESFADTDWLPDEEPPREVKV